MICLLAVTSGCPAGGPAGGDHRRCGRAGGGRGRPHPGAGGGGDGAEGETAGIYGSPARVAMRLAVSYLGFALGGGVADRMFQCCPHAVFVRLCPQAAGAVDAAHSADLQAAFGALRQQRDAAAAEAAAAGARCAELQALTAQLREQVGAFTFKIFTVKDISNAVFKCIVGLGSFCCMLCGIDVREGGLSRP